MTYGTKRVLKLCKSLVTVSMLMVTWCGTHGRHRPMKRG